MSMMATISSATHNDDASMVVIDNTSQGSQSQLGRLGLDVKITMETSTPQERDEKVKEVNDAGLVVGEAPSQDNAEQTPNKLCWWAVIGSPQSFEGNSILLRTSIFGVMPTLVWRLCCMVYFFAVGIVWEWVDTDWSYIPAPVYLTHWGGAITTTYFALATMNSCQFVLKNKEAENAGPGIWSVLSYAQMMVFETALVLELVITGLYWALVYDGSCGFGCVSVHALAFAALFIEFWIAGVPVQPKHVIITILYPVLWFICQALWIFTGHDNCYSVLTLRDIKSAVMTVLAFFAFLLIHMIFAFGLVPLRKSLHSAGLRACSHSRHDSYQGVRSPTSIPPL